MVTYKQTAGPRRTAVALGLAAGLAAATAASLGVVGTASASCVNISGIAIGGGGPTGHCQASFGSLSIVIGPTPTDEEGSDAFAGNSEQFSPFNIAISVGGTAEQPTFTSAGRGMVAGLPSIGNVSFATAGSDANTGGVVNLAASFGGTDSDLLSAGVGNSALNLGSHNALRALGVVNNSTVLFSDGNRVEASSDQTKTGLQGLSSGFNVAFGILGSDNTVSSGAFAGTPVGPLAITGAIGVTGQTVANSNFGITLRTPFNATAATSVLAAGNKVAPTTLATGSFKSVGSQLRGSLKKAGSQLSGSLNKPGKQVRSSLNSLSQKVADTTSKAKTSGSSGGSGKGGASAS